MHPTNSRFVVLIAAYIATVFGAIYGPQVGYAVIGPIVVYVVYFIAGPCKVNMRPRDPVREKPQTQKHTCLVSVLVSVCERARSRIPRIPTFLTSARAPQEQPCTGVVVQQLTQHAGRDYVVLAHRREVLFRG
jgi:hypothetical protein